MKLNESPQINNLINAILDTIHDIRRNQPVEIENLLQHLMDAEDMEYDTPEFESAGFDVGEFVDKYQQDKIGIKEAEALLNNALAKLRRILANKGLNEEADPDVIEWINRFDRLGRM